MCELPTTIGEAPLMTIPAKVEIPHVLMLKKTSGAVFKRMTFFCRAFCLNTQVLFCALALTVSMSGCLHVDIHQRSAALETVFSNLTPGPDYVEHPLVAPLASTIYPSDIAAPLFAWPGPSKGSWIIRVFNGPDGSALFFSARSNPWEPSFTEWEEIKKLSYGSEVGIEVVEIRGNKRASKAVSRFIVSRDPFNARILYQEIPVPFAHAAKNTKDFRWRMFDPASTDKPRVILQGLPYCANCHVLSQDGRMFGLDVDYRGDRGGFMLSAVKQSMQMNEDTVISWNDHRSDDLPQSRGLFAKISPSGDYVVASVKERPFLIRIEDPAYSQLFFPLSGYLSFYSVHDRTIRALPGADDEGFVQISPEWSPDGQSIVFARGQACEYLWETLGDKVFLDAPPGKDIKALSEQYQMRFDLWALPFNEGRGGQAVPLEGGGANGLSNYFPRYTPDGKWIVFCQAPSGLVSMPDSKLVIIPSGGGQPRIMNCNRKELNSWHSFSPNGRWMVFSSKPEDSIYTRVFLTHIDEYGNDSPAILLHRIGSPRMAAILPEAVALDLEAIRSIDFIE